MFAGSYGNESNNAAGKRENCDGDNGGLWSARSQCPVTSVGSCRLYLNKFRKKTDAVRVHGTEKQASLLQILELNDDLQ